MIFQADIWLIENVFEKFSHWWQKTVSYKQDCFWWARTAFICVLLCVFMIVVTEGVFVEFKNPKDKMLLFPIVFLCFLTPLIFSMIQEIKIEAYHLLSQHLSNFCKTEFYKIRVFTVIITFVVILLNTILEAVFSLLIALMFCLLSCDPLPPSNEKSRLQKWAASVREKMTPSPSPVPASA